MSADHLPNLLPTLDAATEQALRASIEKFGVLVPVLVDQDGRLLDGHHRTRIANDLGKPIMRRSVIVRDDDHAREIAVEANTVRRHMPPEQRREVVAALREAGHSVRAIASAVGAPKSTVADDLKVSGSGHLPPESVGRDGKRYPSSRPAPTKVVQPSPPEGEQIPGQTSIPTPVPVTSEDLLQVAADDGSEDAQRALIKARDARVLLRFDGALGQVLSTVESRDNLLDAITRIDRDKADDLSDFCGRMADFITRIGAAAARQSAPTLRRVQ